MLDDLNAQSQESLPEEQNSGPQQLSDDEIASAAKARLKAWEMAVITIFVVPGILALFAFWPIGILLIGVGVYFRHLAIKDHKNAILFEMGLYHQKVSDEAAQRQIVAQRKAEFKEEQRKLKEEYQKRVIVRQAEELARQDEKNRLHEAFLLSVRRKCNHIPIVATVLGVSGMPLVVGEVVWVSCRTDTVAFSRIVRQEDYTIPYSILMNAEVTGPGTERSNAGVIGGGFGLEGAAKGILIATAINALTSTKKTNTFFNLSTNGGEVRLHVTTLEPEQLRLTLSPVFVRIEAQKHVRVTPNSLSSEIEKLSFLRSSGELTDEEFASAKKKLLVG